MTVRVKKAPLPASAYVVLGMIQLGRRSGYEIKQAVELSIRFFWTISPAQIYPSLEILEQAGLIRGRDDPRGHLARRAYTVTRAGAAAFEEWLRKEEALPFELRDVGLVKLFFADLLNRDAALHLLETIGNRSADRVAQLRAIEPAADSVADDEGYSFPRVTLRLGIAFHQALVDECDKIKDELTGRARRRRT
ncbi:MAG TPA: PadR family transcriptional regulator [Roseiarcus sp.]|nr:PadR family transcriptional regulator [Roseiarcus sp.]